MHGDITTRKGVNLKNIVAKIGYDVRAYAYSLSKEISKNHGIILKKNRIHWKDIEFVRLH
jgi:hypothetical protein